MGCGKLQVTKVGTITATAARCMCRMGSRRDRGMNITMERCLTWNGLSGICNVGRRRW